MANVNIKFNNKDYLLSCDDGQEENLKELANHLDSKYSELKKSLGNIGENKLLLITAIQMVDDYFNIFQKVKNTKNDFEKLSTKFKELRSLAIKYKNEKDYNKQKLTDLYYQNFQLNINFIENEKIPEIKKERWFSPIDRTLRRELKTKFSQYWFDTTSYKDLIDIKIAYENGIFEIIVPKERVTNSSARIFALWITVPAFL